MTGPISGAAARLDVVHRDLKLLAGQISDIADHLYDAEAEVGAIFEGLTRPAELWNLLQIAKKWTENAGRAVASAAGKAAEVSQRIRAAGPN